MSIQDNAFVQTPPQIYHEETAVPRAEPIVVSWPWQRLALGAILLIAAAFNFWQLNQVGYGNTYYAAAVRSMLESWHNFIFNSFDPGGFVTIDKPPVGFWLQVASAKIFGYSGLSLMLPQALAGVLSVAVLYRLVSRSFGAGAGLLAALALAVMPVNVAANRNNIIDSTLVLVLLFGAWAVLRAAETGKLRWLLLCAFLVGVGFNVKMLEAFLVVPAFGLLYLLAAPVKWTTRLWQLVVATVVLLAISLSWAVAVDATPASQRPYVGSSGTNSELNLAFGYNGLERLTGRIFGRRFGPANPPANSGSGGLFGLSLPGGNSGGFTRGETGNPGPLRLFNSALGGQASWLLVLAIIGAMAAAWQRRPRFPLNRREQSVVLWGMWLLTMGVFFSIAGFFHAYYLVMISPAIAALAGIGLAMLWQDYRRPGWRGWVLPFALLATAAVQVEMLTSYPDWSRWLTPLLVVATGVAAVLLLLLRLGRRLSLDRRVTASVAGAAALLGIAGLLAAPTAWAADTVSNSNGGLTPSAGPRAQDNGFPGGGFRNRRANDFPGFGSPPGGFGGQPGDFGGPGGEFAGGGFGGRGPGGDGGVNAGLLKYLEAHQGTTRFLFATSNANSASGYIIQTGKPVMAMGGFLGSDPILTTSSLAHLVANNTVRFFLVQGFGGFGRGGGSSDLTQWITTNCAAVPSSDWQSTSATQNGFGGGFFGGGGELYDCAAKPSQSNNAASTSGGSNATTAPSISNGNAATGAGSALIGQLTTGIVGSVMVQSFQGQQSLPATAGTRYYQVVSASRQALAAGQRVAIVPDTNSLSAAGSVIMAPANGPYISVLSFGFGGRRGNGFGANGAPGGNGAAGGSGGFGTNGGFGSQGGPGGNGPGGFGGRGNMPGRTADTGTITALTSQAVTLKMATSGLSMTFQMTSSTRVFGVRHVAPSQLQPNTFVAVGTATVGSRQVATVVVGSTINGAIPSIVTATRLTPMGTT